MTRKRSIAAEQQRRYRIGVDIGGTFTDFVLLDTHSGRLDGFKLLTSVADPSNAVFEGLEQINKRFGIASADVGVIVHATTLATNTLIEQRGATIGMITTEGFRDVLEMRRETRYDDLDLAPEFPPPLAPRHLRLGVKERVLADGSIRVPIDEADVRRVIAQLKSEGVETLAVCLLHAAVNPAHEKVIARIAAETFDPDLISISSAVQPEIREYERMCTTAANAYVQPRLRRYIDRLQDGITARGYQAPLYIMQSNGGFAGPAESSRFPVRLIESGPAAGAIAAAHYGKVSGINDLISFDMGGTTAKIAVLKNGNPRISPQLEVARVHRFKSGSGYPIRCPSIELSEIGAGGGSIASVDALGLVRVGPRSAGAMPGPACYGQGGEEPTVTDADLILGYIDADYFAGGRMKLDRAAAEQAIRRRICAPLGLDLTRAAWGIHDIVNQNMATAARLHVLERGEDPRRFTLVAFGGAGPIHAHRIAAALGVERVLHPANAGVASARGLMVAPMAMDLVRTYHVRLDKVDWSRVGELFAEMEAGALQAMGGTGVDQITFTRVGDMRYRGQGYEIQTTLPAAPYTDGSHADFLEAFQSTYEGIFGRRIENVAVELVNLRLFARGPQLDTPIVSGPASAADLPAKKGERSVYFGEVGDYVACAIYDRSRLRPGDTIDGPSILEEDDTTVVIAPGSRGIVDAASNVVVSIGKSQRRATPGAQQSAVGATAFDPIELEIAWGQLISIIDEAADALVRTSFSSIVREAKDYTIVLLDRNGRSVAQPTTGAPSFNGTMPRTMRHLLAACPLGKWDAEDFLVTNNPWMGTGHLNDVNGARPIFRDGRLLGFVGVVAHMADIGGIMWSATAREIFEEGIQIPTMKLFERGVANQTAFDFIRLNVRQPEIVSGDLYAMFAAARVVDRRLNEFLNDFGAERWERLADEVISRSEAAMRAEIRKIPEGVYTHEIPMDGFAEPMRIKVAVTIKDGSILVDYAGSSPQVPFGINSPDCYTYAYTAYPLKCLCNPGTPNNEGTFRAIEVRAPEGSFLHPVYPAPTSARSLGGHPLHAAVFGALAGALPDRVIAESSSPRPTLLVSGYRADNSRFHNAFFLMGGLGAWAGGDGSACLPYPTNILATPTEILENDAPILFESKELITDSGGAGRHRGGTAQEATIRNLSDRPLLLSIMSERTKTAPQGLFGGGPGARPHFFLDDGTALDPKGIATVAAGQAFNIRTHGGGGYGNPAERTREKVQADVRDGYVSREAAKSIYGKDT